MKYLKSPKCWFVFLLISYSVFGLLVIPWFVTNKASPLIKEKLGVHVEFGKAEFNPYSLTLSVEDVLLKDLDEKPVLGLKKVRINYDLTALLFSTLLFKSIDIESPRLFVELGKDGKLNLENILPSRASSPEEKSESTTAIVLRKLAITDGSISFTDAGKTEPFSLKLGPYSFKAHDISTKEGDLNAHNFRTKISGGGEIYWEGGMKLNPLSFHGEVQISNLELPKFYSYALPNLDASLKSGTLSLRLPYQVDLKGEVQTKINGADLTLTDIVFEDGKPLMDISQIKLTGFYLKLPEQKIEIEGLDIDDSNILAVLDKNQNLNLVSAFQDTSIKAETNASSDSKPWSFLLHNLDLTKADINLHDLQRDFKAKLSQISLHVKSISSQESLPIKYEFSSVLNQGTDLKASGDIIQKPLSLTSQIDLQNLHVTDFLSFIEPYINLSIQNANIDMQADVKAELEDEIDFTFKANTSIKSLHVNSQNDDKFLSWSELHVEGLDYKHKESFLNIHKLTLEQAYINAYLNKDGSTSFSNLLKESKSEKETKSEPFNYMINEVVISDASLDFEDKTVKKPIKSELRNTSLHVKDISSQDKLPIEFELASILNKNTKLDFAGSVVQKPLVISSKIDIDNLNVPDFGGYIEPFVNFDIKSASLYVKADVKAELGEDINFIIKADTSVKKLHIDGADGKKLLAWEKLKLNAIKYVHKPTRLDIKDLKLDTPFIRAHIDKDGTTNFSNLIKEAKTTQKEVESEPMKIKIGPIKLVNGTSDFSDYSLPFPFATFIHDLHGDFSTLDFQTTTPSLLNLSGKIDKYGYTNITGMFSPLNIKENGHLSIFLKNIDLSSLSPYSGKFVGRKIESGKLSMDLKYSVKELKLIGENKINIDTLTLGEKVDSPDASSLPLELAIALLEDSEGQIDIDLPVTGDMHNPEFSYGSVIWGAVGNMITGIVTAPFKFLGAMLGVDGDSLKSIDFDKGSYEIISTEHEKLENLQKILAKRPAIKLAITAGYDEVYDIKALQEQKLIVTVSEELKKLKVDKEASKTDTYGMVLKKLFVEKFSEKKYEEKRKKALVNEKGEKLEFDVVAFNTSLQNELLKEIEVSQEELISLAKKRASGIKSALAQKYKIDEKRVTIKAPEATKAKRDRWIGSKLEIAI